jgi:hypothetical protein
VYRERNELQEHRCKSMGDHGALKTNDGRKNLVAPDRHQQRARATLEQSLAAAHKRVDKKAQEGRVPQTKVAESEAQGHGKRLDQRRRACARGQKARQEAQDKHTKLHEQAAALGPPRERADRDFRKQTIMTWRTLLLETALMAFRSVLLGHLNLKVSLDCILHILFERSGARMETDCHIVSWVTPVGLSTSYQRLLTAVVDGLNAMDLREQGKSLHIRLKGLSP